MGEKNETPVSSVNEIVLRAFFNEQFNIPIPVSFSEFVGKENYDIIELEVA